MVCDGRGQMGLARAVAAQQHQPTVRVAGIGQAELIGIVQPAANRLRHAHAIGEEIVERHPRQRTQVTHRAHAARMFGRQLRLGAAARHDPIEVRVAGRHVVDQEAAAFADGARLRRIANCELRIASVHRGRLWFIRFRTQDRTHHLTDALHGTPFLEMTQKSSLRPMTTILRRSSFVFRPCSIMPHPRRAQPCRPTSLCSPRSADTG